ncbi:hypothetical protein SLEP1_g9285 [Rubroshorea leprosula]|uniref:Uncharacterized protein n=1 Tax=Rubroshorea leprosula TaxID=152421 RepID=A0AAV5IDR4_9ROSI|nr:hypothetical protein SLEP1_g9285 [Rubroshorea leprosula]
MFIYQFWVLGGHGNTFIAENLCIQMWQLEDKDGHQNCLYLLPVELLLPCPSSWNFFLNPKILVFRQLLNHAQSLVSNCLDNNMKWMYQSDTRQREGCRGAYLIVSLMVN